MICPFNHEYCVYIDCPLWDQELKKCLFHLAINKILGRPAEVSEKPPLLSLADMDILQLLAAGRRNREIAEVLCISPRTVTKRVAVVLQKLEAKDRAQAVVIAVQKGII